MKVAISLLCTLAAGAWLVMAPAAAQDKDLAVVPANPEASVQLDIRMNQYTVAIGGAVQFDFVSSADGYVTLWDIGTSGRVSRIYPNTLGGDSRVRAGIGYGAGGPQDNFAFEVNGPPGMEDVYLVWTRHAEAQPDQLRYISAQVLSKDLVAVERLDARDWATAKVTFEITQDGQPQTARLAAPTASAEAGGHSRVYLLAMGANVGELTKTNADARHFADTLQRLFSVPSAQVRVLENAYKRDFAAGMEWLRQSARSGDLVLIFFSGHGTTVADDDGDEADGLDEAYVMYDAEQARYPSAHDVVRDDEFAVWVDRLPTDRVIVFIDACFSGGLSKALTNVRTKFFVGGELGMPSKTGGWQQKAKALLHKDLPGGTDGRQGLTGTQTAIKGLLYAAAQENEYALEVAEGGLFVTRLLERISQAQKARLADLFAETRHAVQQDSHGQQTPVAVGNTALGETLNLTTDTH
ncbi:MAG: caspase family protein [Gammaproteobacteria bacterium]|nr:caspase family protein [Gammaproteobacteria bacterium]